MNVECPKLYVAVSTVTCQWRGCLSVSPRTCALVLLCVVFGLTQCLQLQLLSTWSLVLSASV